MKPVVTVVNTITWLLKNIAGFLVFFSTLLSTAGAISRYSFKMPIVWIDEICVYAILLMVFLIMPELEYSNNQLTISAILRFFGDRGHTVLIFIRGVITMAASCILAYYGFVIAQRSIERMVLTPVIRFPKGIPYYIVASCFVLSVLVWIIIMLRKGKYKNVA